MARTGWTGHKTCSGARSQKLTAVVSVCVKAAGLNVTADCHHDDHADDGDDDDDCVSDGEGYKR